MWYEKDGVRRAVILTVIANTIFIVYLSGAYNAKLLWKKFDQTYNFELQCLDFKLVDSNSVTEHVHEFEMIFMPFQYGSS